MDSNSSYIDVQEASIPSTKGVASLPIKNSSTIDNVHSQPSKKQKHKSATKKSVPNPTINETLKHPLNTALKTPERDIVALSVTCAKRQIIQECRKETNYYWDTHCNELICDLCGESPNLLDTDYWGECPRMVEVDGTKQPKSVILCPKCLFSKWYLYRPGNMKVSQPNFTNTTNTTFCEMRWRPVSQTRTMSYLRSHIKHATMQLLPQEVISQLYKQTGIEGTTIEELPFQEQRNYDQGFDDNFPNLETYFTVLNPIHPSLRFKNTDEHTEAIIHAQVKPQRQPATLKNKSFSELCRILGLVYNRYKYTTNNKQGNEDFSTIEMKDVKFDDANSEQAVASLH